MQLVSRTDEFQFSFTTEEDTGSCNGLAIEDKPLYADLRYIAQNTCLSNLIFSTELSNNSDLRRFAKIRLPRMAIRQEERDYLAERRSHVLPIFDAFSACRSGVLFPRIGQETSIESIKKSFADCLFSTTYYPSKEDANYGNFSFSDLAKFHLSFSIEYNAQRDALFEIGRNDLPFETTQVIKAVLAFLATSGNFRTVCCLRSRFKNEGKQFYQIKQENPIEGASRRLNELLMVNGISNLASFGHISEDTVLRIPRFGTRSRTVVTQALSSSNIRFGSAHYKLVSDLRAEFQHFRNLYYFSDLEN